MRFKNILNDEKGMGLMGVLLGVAGLGLLSLGVITIFKNQMSAQSTLARKYESMDLRRNLERVFMDTELCTCQFKGLQTIITGGVVQKIKLKSIRSGCDTSAPTLISEGMMLGTGGSALTVKEISVDNSTIGGSTMKSQIQVVFQPRDDGGLSPAPIRANQVFTLDSTGAIESCAASSVVSLDTLQQICERFGGTFTAVNEECRLKPMEASCPNGQIATGISSSGSLNCVDATKLITDVINRNSSTSSQTSTSTSTTSGAAAYTGPKFVFAYGSFSTPEAAQSACQAMGKSMADAATISKAISSASATGQKLMDILNLPSGAPALVWTAAERRASTGVVNVYYPGHNSTSSEPSNSGPYPRALCM